MRSVNLGVSFGKDAPLILCSLLTMLMPIGASALEWLDGKVQVHGFVGQGVTYTDHYQVFGTSNDVSLDFREMGINTSVKLLPNLLISAQGLYRDAGASDTQGLRLDFAQIDYSVPLLDSSLVVGTRGGRVKIPFGLYNDTRDVVWTRPTVLLPQSIYLDTLALRQAQIAADGGILYSRYTHGDHRFGVEFLAAELQDNTGGTAAFLTGLPAATSLGGRPLLLGRAVYEWKGGRGRLMATVADVDRDFHSSVPMIASNNGNVKLSIPLFSAQYNAEHWSLTTEYAWIDSERTGFFPGMQKNTSENFYVQGEYRFTQDFSGVLRYDVFHVNREDRDGKQLSEMTGLPRHRFYARDLTVGLRWEFARNFLLAADYHHVTGTAWLNTTENPDLMNGGGVSDWNLFMTMLSFRF
jgi:predicted porin